MLTAQLKQNKIKKKKLFKNNNLCKIQCRFSPLFDLWQDYKYPIVYIYPSYIKDVHIINMWNMLKGMTEVSSVVKAPWDSGVLHQLTQLRSKVTVLFYWAPPKGSQMVDLEKDTRRWWFSPRSWLWNSIRHWMASSTEPIWISAILWSFWKNLNPLTMAPVLENSIFRSSSTTEGGMLERWSVEDGGKILE